MMLRLFLLLIASICAGILPGQQSRSQFPTDQQDMDKRTLKGRSGTHHWQPYMADADLGSYRHAPEDAVEDFRDMKYGLRIHWGVYSIINARASWDLRQYMGREDSSLAYQGFYHDLYKEWYPE